MEAQRWGWGVVQSTLDDLGVSEDRVEQRGDTIRFAVAEGLPTFLSVEPASQGLDLYGFIRIEVTTVAAEVTDFNEEVERLLDLNLSSPSGRWVWNSNGDISRTASVFGHPEMLSFLPALLPGLTRLTVADSVRANRITEGRWTVSQAPTGGSWTQGDALQWLYALIGHQAVGLPVRAAIRHEYEAAREIGRDLWYSAGVGFQIAEAAFADFDDDGQDPTLRPVGSTDTLRTVLGSFEDIQENPHYGKGSLVGLRLPDPLPADYRWPGSQSMNVLSRREPMQTLGGWSTKFEEDGRAFPQYASFIPSQMIAALTEDDRSGLALALARDALAQTRYAARLYRTLEANPAAQEVRTLLSAKLRPRRAAAARTLSGAGSPIDYGAETIAHLADDRLQVDKEWSIRDDHRVTWLPHHQMQTFAAEPVTLNDRTVQRVMIETSVGNYSGDAQGIDERIDRFNASTSLTTLLRREDGDIVLHSSHPIHSGNAWWLREWLADVAVLQLVESDRLVGEVLDGRLEVWEVAAHELNGLRREEPDGIMSAIEVLAEHSDNYAGIFDEPMFVRFEDLLSSHLSGSRDHTSSGSTAHRYHVKIEDVARQFTACLEPARHQLLGPSLRVSIAASDPLPGSASDANRMNVEIAATDHGLWTPLVAQEGNLVATTLLPASATRGLDNEAVAGLVFNVVTGGVRTVIAAAGGAA